MSSQMKNYEERQDALLWDIDHIMTLVDNLVDKEMQWNDIKDVDMTQPEWDTYHNAICIAKDRIRNAMMDKNRKI